MSKLLCGATQVPRFQRRRPRGLNAMTIASATSPSDASPAHGLERCKDAVSAAERLLHLARVGVRKSVEAAGGIDAAQAAAHGLAWLATYVESLRQMLGWATRLEAAQRLGE